MSEPRGASAAAEDPGTIPLLLIALDAAVPIRIHQISHWSIDRILHPLECQRLADVVAERGDIIQWKGSKKGATAKAFVELVEALARLAYMPGGCEFAGRVYAADHSAVKPKGLAKTWPGPLSEADARRASKRRRKR